MKNIEFKVISEKRIARGEKYMVVNSMRWWRFLPLLFTFLFSLFTSFVQAQKLPEVSLLRQDTGEVMLPWPVNVQTRLDSLVKDTLFERTQLGLMVYDLSADSVLYSYGGKQALRPASTMKLLTSVAALDLLGSGYAFRTYLYYKGTISQASHFPFPILCHISFRAKVHAPDY